MKKITLLALFTSLFGFAQMTTVTLIDPAGDGGFETGTTIEANNWLTAQPTANNKKWYAGTGQAGYTGQRAAFIGNNATTVGNGNPDRIVHFYREVTFPATATNIVLTFKYKQALADIFLGESYDYLQVNTSATVPENADDAEGDVQFGPYPDVDDAAGIPTFTTQTVNLPNTLAGQTRYLIFTFYGDNVEPNGMGAIDDISLTYEMPTAATVDFKNSTLAYYPNPVKDVFNIAAQTPLTYVEVYNLLGQQVFTKTLNAADVHLDLSALASGNYIVRAYAGEDAKSIKINKE
ncbi:MAG: T9SS type A sorting domain-containing protein [Flavobacterium sp.]